MRPTKCKRPLSSSFDALEGASHSHHTKSTILSADERTLSFSSHLGSQKSFGSSARGSVRPSSSNRIRSRYLNHLGIVKEPAEPIKRNTIARHMKRSAFFQADLKADHGKFDDKLDASRPVAPCGNPSKGVSFEAAVTVYTIPSRSDYSERMRCVLWASPMDRQADVARNCVEFAAENWDSQQVVSDDAMIDYAGEKVHPVHFVMQDQSLRQNFFSALSAQSHRQSYVAQAQPSY